MNGDKPAHLRYGDLMRVAALLAVVLIHAAALAEPANSYGAVLLDTACRWCVPVFFMLSGALLLDPARSETASQFYRRRMSRVVLPLVAWSLIYFAWRGIYLGEDLTLRVMTRDVLIGRPYGHLWFVYALLGLYVATPVLRSCVRHLPRNHLWGLAALCVGASAAASATWAVLGTGSWRTPPSPVVPAEWAPYIGYYLLGYLLRDGAPGWSAGRAFALFVVIAALGTIARLVAINFDQPTRGEAVVMNYVGPFGVLLSFTAFLSLQWAGQRSDGRVMHALGGAVFGAYLAHWLILKPLVDVLWSGQLMSTIDIIAAWSLAGPLSLLAGWSLARTPGLRVIVGEAGRSRRK